MKKILLLSCMLVGLIAQKSFATCTDTIKPAVRPYIYVGQSITLSDAVSGTWSSSNTSVATIGTGGVLTPLTTGTVMITHTNSVSCTSSITVTVNSQYGPGVFLNIGTANYVTIGGQDYRRSMLGVTYSYGSYTAGTYDSTAAIYNVFNGRIIVPQVSDTMFIYADSSNRINRSLGQLQTWFRTNLQ